MSTCMKVQRLQVVVLLLRGRNPLLEGGLVGFQPHQSVHGLEFWAWDDNAQSLLPAMTMSVALPFVH